MKNISDGFYSPEQITELYPALAQAYVSAFAGEPWYEVSTCPQPNQKPSACNDGLSPVAVGQLCADCGQCPTQPAYTTEALVQKFTKIAQDKETDWYIEFVEGRVAMAALAWVSDVATIATERYGNNPNMRPWMQSKLPPRFVWLDEVFADKQVRATRNLANFTAMVGGFSTRLECETVAYRTITPQMIQAGKRAGGEVSQQDDASQLPDRRSFVRINTTDRV